MNCRRSVQVFVDYLLINLCNVNMIKILRAVLLHILIFRIVINMPIAMHVECHHPHAILIM